MYAPHLNRRFASPRENGPETYTKRHNSTGTCWTRFYGKDGSLGSMLFSYDTPIKANIPGYRLAVVTSATYSNTTSHHFHNMWFPDDAVMIAANEAELLELAAWLLARAKGGKARLPRTFKARKVAAIQERKRRTLTIGDKQFYVSHVGSARSRKYYASGDAWSPDGEKHYWSMDPVYHCFGMPLTEAELQTLTAFVDGLRRNS